MPGHLASFSTLAIPSQTARHTMTRLEGSSMPTKANSQGYWPICLGMSQGYRVISLKPVTLSGCFQGMVGKYGLRVNISLPHGKDTLMSALMNM